MKQTCDCELNYGNACLHPTDYATTGCNHQFNKRIKQNADSLIEMGGKEWYRNRRRGKKTQISQEDQLREIEDKLLEES